MRQYLRLALMVSIGLAAVPAVAYAQASFAGSVRDTSGGVLPGVTVEAASPALIEQVRSVVTDGTGQYRIENLRPGTYTLTFTLPGFSVVSHEGLELTGTFTATVNAEMQVGALEETITVTGESPVVDVQSTTRQTVLDAEIIDAIPTGRSPYMLAATLPGVTRSRLDIGGTNGDGAARGNQTTRGNTDTRVIVGGLGLHSATGQTSGVVTALNIGAYQEVAVDTGGIGAENAEGGVIVNLIPRDGGNTFSGRLYANFGNNAMQADNFTQDLQDRGLGTPNSVRKLWEFNPAIGGPIQRDRLWFHWSARHAGSFQNVPMFFNRNAGDPTKWTYEADTSRPAANENIIRDFSTVRLTWQATPKNKVAINYSRSDILDHPRGMTARTAPEALANNYTGARKTAFAGEWSAPLTNRVLLEASFGRVAIFWPRPGQGENPFLPPGTVGMISVQEQSTGITYRATASNHETDDHRIASRVALSYVTGAHAFKAGFSFGAGKLNRKEFSVDAPMLFRFRNGVPNRITLNARDRTIETNLDSDHGLFVQDRWTVGRLTLTAGLRYDLMAVSYPEVRVGPSQFAPNRNFVFPEEDGITWHDLSPRSGLAYDLFGDGKTALKVSMNRYVAAMAVGSGGLTAVTTDPGAAASIVTRTNRSWRDANRDFVPDCDLVNPAANGECGRMSNRNFGTTVSSISYDSDLFEGWNIRPHQWQFEVGVQREIVPGVSMNVSYWRSWKGNILATADRALGPSDFDEFSVTAPVDPRLPGGGGQTISGLFDIKPEKFGVPSDFLLSSADKFGKQTDVWNGFDLTVDARPAPGVFVQGGSSTQRQSTDTCEVVTQAGLGPPGRRGAPTFNPSQLYCDATGTFLTSVKFLASYTVPRIDVQVSGNFQNLPGPEIIAAYVVSSAEVAQSLGRRLAGRRRNVTVNLFEPRSMYAERTTRLDLRVGKILRFGRTRAVVSVDLYNALNSSAVLGQRDVFGSSWLRPEAIYPARFAKIGLQLEF